MPKSYGPGAGSAPGISFKMNVNDKEFRKALHKLKQDGPKITHEVLKKAVIDQLKDTKSWLVEQAGAFGGVKAPGWEGNPASEHAYVKIAKSLFYDDKRGKGFLRIFSGPDYKIGVKGSRMSQKYGDVSLAKIHGGGGGARPFAYPDNLPMKVRSSVPYYVGTGKAGNWSSHMKLKGIHPGFPNANYPMVDYATHAEQGVHDKWVEGMIDAIMKYGKRYWMGGSIT